MRNFFIPNLKFFMVGKILEKFTFYIFWTIETLCRYYINVKRKKFSITLLRKCGIRKHSLDENYFLTRFYFHKKYEFIYLFTTIFLTNEEEYSQYFVSFCYVSRIITHFSLRLKALLLPPNSSCLFNLTSLYGLLLCHTIHIYFAHNECLLEKKNTSR